ncbi:efflux RND transporter periplasmic adaptor subunit [Capsulimonas corticalis]|nr:HlyD family efflux transporter periplasmic adaptor subunit [Capsulimonas corticalis]
MKKSVKTAIGAVIVLAAVAAAGSRVSHNLHKPAPPPRTVPAALGDISVSVQEVGAVQPVDKVDVRSKVAGRILVMPIEAGQTVHAGQLIAMVDRTLLDPQIQQTQAQLDQAKARLTQAESSYQLQLAQTKWAIEQAVAGLATAKAHLASVAAGARPQEVAQQKQALARAQIALDDAVRTQARKQALVVKGFVSQSEADTSQVALDTARSNVAAAQEALSLTQAGPRAEDVNDARVGVHAAEVQLATARANALQDAVRKSDIDQARGNVQQIAGNLSQLEVQVGDTKISAPVSGIVLKKYRQPGEIVQSATTGFSDAQSIVATLGSRLEVQVGINEVDVAKIRVGAPVTIAVDAAPGVAFAGTVTEIAPASTNAFADTSTASATTSISKFSVRIAFQKYDARIRPGMSANVTILSDQRKHVVVVPLEVTPFTGNTGKVQVLNAAGKPEDRTVTLGLRDDTRVEVKTGLGAGDKVIVPAPSVERRTIDISGGPDGG